MIILTANVETVVLGHRELAGGHIGISSDAGSNTDLCSHRASGAC